MSERKIDDRDLQNISGAGDGKATPFKEVNSDDSGEGAQKLPDSNSGGGNTGLDTDNTGGSGNANITPG